jgi:hypothetical protein
MMEIKRRGAAVLCTSEKNVCPDVSPPTVVICNVRFPAPSDVPETVAEFGSPENKLYDVVAARPVHVAMMSVEPL